MDFIGIGINRNEFGTELLQVLKDNCYPNLYLKLTEGSRMDPEIEKGVNHLSKHKDLEVVQYDLQDETVFTSNNLSQDLIKPFIDQGDSLFLKYLEQIQIYLPNRYYLVFGFEWYEADRIRFISLKGSDLTDYFSKNNGWNLMLYSIENDEFYPDLDVPLIIEVDNSQEA
ncbi:MAG: hypothetical protein V3V00_07135 [Saprospiraceae bacterium]